MRRGRGASCPRGIRGRAAAGRDVAECGLVEAQDADGRGGVATADDRERRGVEKGLGDRLGARGVVGVLEDAHRAVPEDGGRVGELRGVQGTGLGTDVEAHLVGGDGVRGDGGGVGRGLRLQVGERGRGHDVDRDDQLDAVLLGALDVLGDGGQLVVLDQGGADLVALGLEEGEGHAAADEDAVGLAEQLVDDGELVGDLGAAERHHVGPLDVLGELLQDADLGGDEVAGVVRQPGREVVHGGVLAVHGTETVAYVDVRQGGELVGELAALGVVPGGLARVEAQVLDDRDLAGFEAADRVVGGGADGVLGERDRRAEEFGEALGRLEEGEGRVRGALGAAQVRGHDHLGARLDEGLDGGQHGADAAVVGDEAVGQRDVEVGADEDPLAVHAFGEKFVDRLHKGTPREGSSDPRGLIDHYVVQGSGSAACAARALTHIELPAPGVRAGRRRRP